MKLKSSVLTNGIGITFAAVAATTLLTGARLAPNAAGEQQVHIRGNVTAAPVAFTRPALRAGREYTVRSGDTLAVIAGREYGSAYCWSGIYDANRGEIANPDLIYPGQHLRIPGGCGTQPIGPQPVTVAAVSHPAVVKPAANQPSGGYGVSSSFQACVIRTESGGNPVAVNPASGAGGLYGFLPSTWQSLGFSGLPEDASAAVQTQAFWKEYDLMGVSPWQPSDHCG